MVHKAQRNISKCLRFGAAAMILVAFLTLEPCSARPAVEEDDTVDTKVGLPPRSGILDNIFNIPIQTLKAVNELVQSISGSLKAAGISTFFPMRTATQRNINVDEDLDENDTDETKKKKIVEKY